jgi:hypothetical protein
LFYYSKSRRESSDVNKNQFKPDRYTRPPCIPCETCFKFFQFPANIPPMASEVKYRPAQALHRKPTSPPSVSKVKHKPVQAPTSEASYVPPIYIAGLAIDSKMNSYNNTELVIPRFDSAALDYTPDTATNANSSLVW